MDPDAVPSDVWLHIFSFLSFPRAAVSLGRVSRRFHDIACERALWHDLDLAFCAYLINIALKCIYAIKRFIVLYVLLNSVSKRNSTSHDCSVKQRCFFSFFMLL